MAGGLVAVAARPEAWVGARVLGRAARVPAQALERGTERPARWYSAEGLAVSAAQLEPAQAARVLGQALERETESSARWYLAEGLAVVATRLENADRNRVLSLTYETLRRGLRTMPEGSVDWMFSM